MRIKLPCLLLFCFFLFAVSYSQTVTKKLIATKITSPVKIDGNLNEPVWKTTTPAKDFIEFRPNPGARELESNRTEIFILYDNTSIYIGGYCYEKTADSISKELVGRDRIGNSDFLGVIFDTYYDKINASGFYVTPYGEQFDAKYSGQGNEDETWNAVWDSEAKIQTDGWTFEMRIPYSALRFSSKDNQTWGLNITRRRQKTSQQYFWNNVDPNKNGFINQEGEWTGIQKISSPLRLSFSPYFSTYINHYPYKTTGVKDVTSSVNGGMDVKYGISQSFTLDMTVVPDFGQVQSDNQVLNLTPFEVKFNENRSFFTEGTELFNKGNLFYSRRVGGTPIHFGDVGSGINSTEHIKNNPSEAKLINATKISGRTSKNLGIGFFNAVTKPMYATVEDDHGNARKIITNPLTNYNIFVLDQSLKNNSSVSFINTNVLREGKDYDANVTAALFDINTKKNTYNWNGKVAVSNLSNVNNKTVLGYSHSAGFGKTGGRFNFMLSQELTNDKYDPNDLGILFNNNYIDHYLWTGYRWTKPGKWYNNIYLNQNFNLSHRYKSSAYQSFNYNVNVNGQLKNLWYAGLFLGYNATGNDFYEPRVAGRVFKTPQRFRVNPWFNTNRAKKYSLYADMSIGFINLFNGKSYYFNVDNKYRFNDKFSLTQSLILQPFHNDAGYADMKNNDIIFSRRDRNTIENTLIAKYNFNKKNGITFRARHYWSKVKIKEFYILQTDGYLQKNTGYNGNVNQNFNAFNIDMVYTWQFGPGSFINIVWKDAIYEGNQDIISDYFKNFKNTLSASQNNNLSLKIIYYLDYLQLRKKK
ncbi:MAG: DUF5916 domain-containing protein [Ginsengibacter sp.]